MTDTNAKLAELAEKVASGDLSPSVAHAAKSVVKLSDARARRMFFDGLAAFRSNILDAADLCPANRSALLQLKAEMDLLAPTPGEWDAAVTLGARS